MANVCPYCGKPFSKGAQFCPACGKKLSEATQLQTNPRKKEPNSGRTINLILTVTMIIQLAVAGFKYPGFLVTQREPEPKEPRETAAPGNEEPINMEWPFHSRPVDITPVEGIRITAEEGQLFDDTVLSFTPIEEDPDGRIMAAYDELRDEGMYVVGAWEADAGLNGDQALPGEYTVEFDLETLGIPEEMYEYVRIFRLSDDNELTQYASTLNGKTLSYTSYKNTPVLAVIGYTAAITGSLYGLMVAQPHYRKKGYLNETQASYEGHTKWGDYTVYWNMDYMAPDQTDLAIRMIEIQDACRKEAEEEFKLEEERQKLAAGSFMWFFVKNKPIPQRMKELLENNSEYQDLKQQLKVPKNIQVICSQIETAFKFLMDWETIRRPRNTVDFMIREKDPDVPTNLGAAAQPWNDKSYIDLPVPRPDWLTENSQDATKYRDNMLLTVTHELFHICQESYHTSYFTDSVCFDEMTAVVMESDAKDYYQTYDIITTDPKLTDSQFGLTMINPMNEEPWFSRLFLQHKGYYLSNFIQYLRSKTGKNVSTGKIMRSRLYYEGPVISQILMTAFDLSENQFEAAFRKFMVSEADRVFTSYQGKRYEPWFSGFDINPVPVRLNASAHVEMSSQGSYSALIRTFVVQDEKKETFATLIIPDTPPETDRLRVNILPAGNTYTLTPSGAFIAPPARIANTAPKRWVFEVYGNQEGKNGEMGYTVWTVTAPAKPELSQNDTEFIIRLPEPSAAAKAGLIDGMRVNIRINDKTEKTVMVDKGELGKEVRIPLDELRPKDKSDFNASVTLEEYVLSKSGEKLYCPMSEATDTQANADGVFTDLMLVYDDLSVPAELEELAEACNPVPEFPSDNTVIVEEEDVYFDLSAMKLNIHTETSDGVVDSKYTRRGFTMKGTVTSRSGDYITGVLTEIPSDLYGSVYQKQVGYTEEVRDAEGTINFHTRSVSTDNSAFTIEMENGNLKEIRITFKVDLATDNIIVSYDGDQYIYIEDGPKDYTIVLKPS